ncbi:MAG: hypothetical protein Q8M94_00965, partial [Ignavibacteria bacterium]|nr:hypothetical protein [Ignavibacteria bacterium]
METREKINNDPWLLSEILYPKYKFKEFHRDWFNDYIADDEENLCLGPREFGKTTIRGVMGSIWDLVQNPNIQIGQVSDTGPQAIYFISEIKLQLERNKLLTMLYPYLRPGDIWRDNELKIAGATEIKKGVSIFAFGYGGGTGADFDKIIADDMVDFENSRLKTRREKLENWVGISLLPMLRSGGKIRWNGTRYHQDDYYGSLLKQDIKTNSKSHKAIMDNGQSMWPELWPIEKLLNKKERMGSIRFNAQLQNDTKLMEQGIIFHREWFKYYYKTPQGDYRDSDGNRFVYTDLAIYQTCDLALSQSESAHYFVILTFGISKLGNIYIMDVMRGRFSWNEQKSQTKLQHYKWKNDGIRWSGIESVQFQKVLLEEANAFPDVAVRPLQAQKDKVTRAMPMSAKYETGKVYHYNAIPILKDFEDELTTFPE